MLGGIIEVIGSGRAFAVLVDYGWLMPVAGGTTEQGGRSSVI
jgi:hypothetical protein